MVTENAIPGSGRWVYISTLQMKRPFASSVRKHALPDTAATTWMVPARAGLFVRREGINDAGFASGRTTPPIR